VNVAGYSNPDLDALTDKIAVEIDQTKRDDLLNQAIRIIQDNVVALPLHQQVIVWAVKSNIELAQPADNFFPYRFVQVK
jgi:peptide/nickel transport system substrate-binding protein